MDEGKRNIQNWYDMVSDGDDWNSSLENRVRQAMRYDIIDLLDLQNETLEKNRNQLAKYGADVDSLLKRISKSRIILHEMCDTANMATFNELSPKFMSIFTQVTEEISKYEYLIPQSTYIIV